MLLTNAWGIKQNKGPIEEFEVIRRNSRSNDVLIKIFYCGICGTDCHFGANDWNNSVYPLVPGHEIMGQVENVGTNCTKLRPNDLVLVGCTTESCEQCEYCLNGSEQYCKSRVSTYNAVDKVLNTRTYGGYSNYIVVTERFAIKINEKLANQKDKWPALAPLACAGTTVWNPIKAYGKPNCRVGICGAGGLGHLAIKICASLNYRITVFTSNIGKHKLIKEIGGQQIEQIVDTSEVANGLDFILDTIPQPHDTTPLLTSLKYNGVFVVIGVIGSLEFDFSKLKKRTITGAFIGGTKSTYELLDFCFYNDCWSQISLIKPSEINSVWSILKAGGPPSRFVINFTCPDLNS